MARRKKEPRSVHREQIAAAASRLFLEKGVTAVTMDDIAAEAGYSKATLYVYFRNKEALVGHLTLESMEKLRRAIVSALEGQGETRAQYRLICRALAEYQAAYPFYFKTALERIPVEPEPCLPEERETYRVGEAINEALEAFLRRGMERGDLRRDLAILPTIFTFWGALSGLILLADQKEVYLRQAAGLSREAFLDHGMELLYRSIASEAAV